DVGVEQARDDRSLHDEPRHSGGVELPPDVAEGADDEEVAEGGLPALHFQRGANALGDGIYTIQTAQDCSRHPVESGGDRQGRKRARCHQPLELAEVRPSSGGCRRPDQQGSQLLSFAGSPLVTHAVALHSPRPRADEGAATAMSPSMTDRPHCNLMARLYTATPLEVVRERLTTEPPPFPGEPNFVHRRRTITRHIGPSAAERLAVSTADESHYSKMSTQSPVPAALLPGVV